MKIITPKHLADLIDQAKKDWKDISRPLRGMNRNLTGPEVLALSYFMASLTLLNELLPDEKVSDKIQVLFEELDSDSIFDQ